MYVCIVFLIVSLLEEIRGGKNEEENDRGWVILNTRHKNVLKTVE
jgi:hypothetical protein